MAKTKKETAEAVAVNQEAVEKVEKKETEDVVTTDVVDNEVTEDIAGTKEDERDPSADAQDDEEKNAQDDEESEEISPPPSETVPLPFGQVEATKEEYVDYCLPFLPGKEMGDFQTVTLNGKNYQVAYGVPVKVPVGVKEILDDMIRSQRLLKKKIDRLTEQERCIAKLED